MMIRCRSFLAVFLFFESLSWGGLPAGTPVGLNLLSNPSAATSPGPLNPEATLLNINPPLKFQVDQRMQKNVDFWVRIYTQFPSTQGLIHDAKYIDHVYEVMEFPPDTKSTGKLVRIRKKKWKEVLLSVHRKQAHPEKMNDEEKKVFELFKDVDEPNKFLNAAHRKRLRFQLGQKDRFLDGLYQSGRFLPMMESVFKKEGLPLELTRLPFVESSFNIKARSKVGASGIWQFMRSTAKLFIKLNPALDERNDPIRATEAAAKLLQGNYDSLRNWPLAVTAYNHGRKGMMRAVRKVGSEELGDLVNDYHSRSFGFASSNFFTELLAAIEVEKNAEKYFGKIERAPLVDFYEVEIPDFIDFNRLVHEMGWDKKSVRELNLGLSEAVYNGSLLIPKGYKFRVPRHAGLNLENKESDFPLAYAKIPLKYKLTAQRSINYGTSDGSVKKAKKSRKGSSKRRRDLVREE